jgi:hypothetical protein
MVKRVDQEKINEILGRTQCPNDFRCINSGFENLCKANDIGLDDYLECLEEENFKCPFVISFGSGYLCKCPMRIYLAKELKI